MPSRVRSKREQREALTRRLRADGLSWAQVAARVQAAEHVSKRVAMRLAHGWTQWEVARRWNDHWPADGGGAGITDQVISYWETWPQSGREPTVRTLCRLALIYGCGVADLIDEENYTGPRDPHHAGGEPLPGAAGAGGLTQPPEDDTGMHAGVARDDPAPGAGGPAAAGELVPPPVVQVTATGQRVPLRAEVTTVGRGAAVGIRLDEASVSVLHAELVCRGPYVYVADLGLSANGTLVNGRPVTRRLLASGDVLYFGAATAVITGITAEALPAGERLQRPAVPELTRREADVLTALCRPALGHEAFTPPATSAEIAAALVVTEAAVKQHLLRLYAKLRIPEGTNRRTRLANTAITTGLAALPARAATASPGSPPRRAPGDEAA
jgi:hypothetical protein